LLVLENQARTSSEFFKSIFAKVNKIMKRENIEFTVDHFPSSAVGESKFKEMIVAWHIFIR